jgi:hypothetical protein
MKTNFKIMVMILALTSYENVIADSNLNCYPPKHAEIPNLIGTNYHDARKELISNKWQPFTTLNFNTAKDELMYSGNGLGFWEQGYYEVEMCSGTGYAPCVFNFKDVYGNLLQVGTTGEEFPSEKIYATVSSVRFKCS